MPLPRSKNKPVRRIEDLNILLYGRSKIGKSTWASEAQNALFLATEPGLNFLEVHEYPILEWENMLTAYKEIKNEKHTFNTIIIDTLDLAYQMCTDYICKKKAVSHPSDVKFGKVYSAILYELMQLLNGFAFLPYGLILISHTEDKEEHSRKTDKTSTKVVPSIPKKPCKAIEAFADLILYCSLEVTANPEGTQQLERVIYTKPSTDFLAGDRTGRLPPKLPLDFEIFQKAFKGEK
jgi:hypothetical protein